MWTKWWFFRIYWLEQYTCIKQKELLPQSKIHQVSKDKQKSYQFLCTRQQTFFYMLQFFKRMLILWLQFFFRVCNSLEDLVCMKIILSFNYSKIRLSSFKKYQYFILRLTIINQMENCNIEENLTLIFWWWKTLI